MMMNNLAIFIGAYSLTQCESVPPLRMLSRIVMDELMTMMATPNNVHEMQGRAFAKKNCRFSLRAAAFASKLSQESLR